MAIDRNVLTQAGTASVLVWETDASSSCTYFNAAYLEFVGRRLDEMLGRGWSGSVHPDDLPQLLDIADRAFDQRLPFYLEARVRRHDGVYRWFLNVGSPRYLADGTFVGYAGTNFDISESKQSLQTREEEQRQLRSILEHSTTLIAIIDRDFNYEYANELYANFWRMTAADIIGKNVEEIVDAETLVLAKQRLAVASKGDTVEFEHEQVRDGKHQTLRVKFVPKLDTKGDVCGLHLFADDITELREHQRHFELILNNLPARVAYYNRDLELQYANKTFFTDLNRRPADSIGESLSKILEKETFHTALPNYIKATHGESIVYENRMLLNGVEEQVLVYLVPDLNADGETTGVYAMVLDVSQLKQAEAQLRRSDKRFELALQGSQVGFWETERGDNDHFLTENIETLLGLERGKLQNSRQAFYRRVHPDDIESVSQVDAKLMTEPGTHVAEYRLLTVDDQYKWFRSVGETERNANNQFVRAAGTIANIDEIKQAQLNAAQQVQDRDIFLSMLSHELRNPLTAIRFAVDFCLDSGNLDPTLQTMFEIIARQTEQTSRMLADLLDVTRVTGDRLLFDMKSVVLSELLESAVDSIRHKFDAKSQTLEIEIEQNLTTFGDAIRLNQAFTNLLDNASKYSPDSGTVRLSARLTTTSEFPSGCHEVLTASQADILIEVTDGGCGISESDQSSIFELFFQEERSLHRSSGGLGLGLFLVRKIVEAHAGTVSVKSEGIGHGSQFSVRLQTSPIATPTREPSDSRVPTRTYNVVLVEDNRDSRIALAYSLAARGWPVTALSDGEQASEKVPNLIPDLAIVDIGLPGKNGLQLAQEFRGLRQLDDTILIALTGYGQASDQREIENAGFDGHLVKPIEINRLLEMIEQLKRRRDVSPTTM